MAQTDLIVSVCSRSNRKYATLRVGPVWVTRTAGWINGTKYFNALGSSRGSRDGVLKKFEVKDTRKDGQKKILGVWIPVAQCRPEEPPPPLYKSTGLAYLVEMTSELFDQLNQGCYFLHINRDNYYHTEWKPDVGLPFQLDLSRLSEDPQKEEQNKGPFEQNAAELPQFFPKYGKGSFRAYSLQMLSLIEWLEGNGYGASVSSVCWPEKQLSGIIDAIIVNRQPSFVLAESVHGKQRLFLASEMLHAIWAFTHGMIPCHDINGEPWYYDENCKLGRVLSAENRKRFHDTVVMMQVMDAVPGLASDEDSCNDLYSRLAPEMPFRTEEVSIHKLYDWLEDCHYKADDHDSAFHSQATEILSIVFQRHHVPLMVRGSNKNLTWLSGRETVDALLAFKQGSVPWINMGGEQFYYPGTRNQEPALPTESLNYFLGILLIIKVKL